MQEAALLSSQSIVIRESGLVGCSIETERASTLAADEASIEAAYRAGVRHLHLGNFGHGTLRDYPDPVALLVSVCRRFDGLNVSLTASDVETAQHALLLGIDQIRVPLYASAPACFQSLGKKPLEMLRDLREICDIRDTSRGARSCTVVAAIHNAFFCWQRGHIRHTEVCDLTLQAVDAGADAITLADDAGLAKPPDVAGLINAISPFAYGKLYGAIFQDTSGLALRNIEVALQMGIQEVDATIRTPTAVRAVDAGNRMVKVRELLNLLLRLGYTTTVDLELLSQIEQ